MNRKWRITEMNKNFQMCDNCPAVWGVPQEASEELIAQTFSFRNMKRIPVLSWAHPNLTTTITRCAQPLVGLDYNRSKHNESYIECIIKTNDKSPTLSIIDTRKIAEACEAETTGGGYEYNYFYGNVDMNFLGIENIQSITRGFTTLSSNIRTRITEFWSENIKSVLAGAELIVKNVRIHL